MNIWIDIANPSHALFFNSLLNEFDSENIFVTVRDRAETVDLIKLLGVKGKVIGKDCRGRIKKPLNIIYRTFNLCLSVEHFDYVLSLENGISIAVSKLRKRNSILFCDNDLKFLQKKSSFQDVETKIKSKADHIIIPEACYKTFGMYIKNEKLITYNGYKEDIYIADYRPDPEFKDKIPFEKFIILRPEALGSFYVKENRSIVSELLKNFIKKDVNVIYLPREKEDFRYAKGFDIHIPKKPLNGLDLCYYADAVLTGSGTMAREAARMNKTSVSFFPSQILLSVDRQLVGEGKIFHSRNPESIVEYVLSQRKKPKELDVEKSKKVKREVLSIIKSLLSENNNK